MSRRPLLAALALVLVVNAFVLGRVWYNRSGPPDATVTMTERELPIAWRGAWSREDTGVALRINWQHQDQDWLDRAKLASLGFETADPASRSKGKSRPHPGALLSRRVFIVLEYDGPAWRAFLHQKEDQVASLRTEVRQGKTPQRRLDSARKQLERLRRGGSRLFAVDAGTDAAALRRHYADRGRYLIVPGVVRARYGWSHQDKRNRVYGYITRLLPATLHVSAARAQRLPGPSERRPRRYYYGTRGRAIDGAPRYRVTVHYGRRHEAWIGAIEPPAAGAFGAKHR